MLGGLGQRRRAACLRVVHAGWRQDGDKARTWSRGCYSVGMAPRGDALTAAVVRYGRYDAGSRPVLRGGAAALPVLGSSWVALQRGGRGLRDEEGPLDDEGLVMQRCAPVFAVRVVEVVARTGGVACWRGRDERGDERGDGGRMTRGHGARAQRRCRRG